MLSFVLCFHSCRVDNLIQTLRILRSREKSIGEIILVCNDHFEGEIDECKIIEMGMNEYKKNVMCNTGVAEAKFDLVALLDSDRILPSGYFSQAGLEIKRGDFLSCRRIMNLTESVTDEDIEQGNFKFEEEFRSEGCGLWMKNLFSGNTVFHKADYLECGGMDESFVGHGFSDTDMTRKILSKGFNAVWRDESEIHLYHDKNVSHQGFIKGRETRKKMAQENLCKYLKKWKLREYWQNCKCVL